MPFNSFSDILAVIPAILIAITFHEYAHGKVAYFFGDPTPKLQGRLTLNPIKHLDPIGTLLLLVARFGWAKPVQINPYNFHGDRKKIVMYVGLAGPLMNLVLAYLSAVVLQVMGGLALSGAFSRYLQQFFYLLLFYNVILVVFNLVPIPPLDGSKILAGILPSRYLGVLHNLETYGPIILLILVFTGTIGVIIGKPIDIVIRFLIFISSFSFF